MDEVAFKVSKNAEVALRALFKVIWGVYEEGGCQQISKEAN